MPRKMHILVTNDDGPPSNQVGLLELSAGGNLLIPQSHRLTSTHS